MRWLFQGRFAIDSAGCLEVANVIRQLVRTDIGGDAWRGCPSKGPHAPNRTVFWRPNYVAYQVPVTQMVAQQVRQKVPIQTCRYVDQEVVRKIPYQVCRMVQEERVCNVPVTTYRPVVQRVERKVPERVCRMVSEEVVRKVPVTTCRMVYEKKVEPYTVRVCKMVATEQTVQVPRVVCRRVPYTYTYRVPRTVLTRVPLDACGQPLPASSAARGHSVGRQETGPESSLPAEPEPQLTA